MLTRHFRKSVFWLVNPLVAIPIVLACHLPGMPAPVRSPQSDSRAVPDPSVVMLLQLGSDLAPGVGYQLVATLDGRRRVARIHFLGLGPTAQSWTVEELARGVEIQSPPGAFAGRSGEFGTIRAVELAAERGGRLELSFPGTLEHGMRTEKAVELRWNGEKWVSSVMRREPGMALSASREAGFEGVVVN